MQSVKKLLERERTINKQELMRHYIVTATRFLTSPDSLCNITTLILVKQPNTHIYSRHKYPQTSTHLHPLYQQSQIHDITWFFAFTPSVLAKIHGFTPGLSHIITTVALVNCFYHQHTYT